MYLKRTLEEYAKKASAQFPVLMVTGARQVGKTTFLRHLMTDDRTYVTLDDQFVLDLARRDPALFFQRYRPPVLIDEIQYAPELLPYIKMIADSSENTGGIWLTGSQQFQLMQGASESLAGRVAIINLLGLSQRERLGLADSSRPFVPKDSEELMRDANSPALGLGEIYEMIWRGSYPAVVASADMDRDLYYSSYLQTYLQRDVRDLAKVGDELVFSRFLRATAARTGQLVNLTDLARDADISVNTVKNWLSILESSGVIYLLEPYFSNITKRLVKSPKLYYLDTGLCAYLTGWSSPETLESGAMSGAIFETWVVSEVLKSSIHNGEQAPV